MGEVFYKRIVLFLLFMCSLFLVFSIIVNINYKEYKIEFNGEDVNLGKTITGFAIHPIYRNFSSPEQGFSLSGNSLSVSDYIIYKVGYYSINGSTWRNFTLSGNTYSNSNVWLRSLASYSLPNLGQGEHYIIIYSCSYNNGWDCHDNRWQLKIINNTVILNGSELSIFALGRMGSGAYPTMELFIDNKIVSSWVVNSETFAKYTYKHTSVISNNSIIRVNYPNDIYGSTRDLRVDKIVIDGITYESESSANINTGMWDGVNCGGTQYPGNEWLNCTGYIQYSLVKQSNIPNCQNKCSQSGEKQCSENGYITCGNYNNDACLEWSQVTPCYSPQVCVEGVCKTSSSPPVSSTGTTYYVSTSGDDNNLGTFERPWATWQKAFDTARAGDLVYIRGGIYYPTATYEGGVYAGAIEREHSGTEDNPIRIFAYPGENPVLDCRNVVGQGSRFGIYLGYVSYWHLKGLTVRNVPELPGLYASSSGISQSGVSHITYEECTVYNCGDGFSSNGFSDYCYWINCDAYDNVDTAGGGGYADGFKLTNYGSGGNTHLFLSGCRSWHNSDDGFDFLNADGNAKGGYVTIDNCWSFRNGHSGGNGVGFKMGGAINGDANPGINRIVTRSIAWDNANAGFDENVRYDPPEFTGSKLNCIFYNNIAYHNNLANFNYVEGFDFNYHNDGARHIFRNNIAFSNSYGNAATPDSYCTHDHNSWDTSGIYVNENDFVTLNDDGADGPREDDGSLPNIDFLRLKSGSDLVDAGVDVDLDYFGSRPDIGAFEYR